ncbi:MAG: HAMP domain-containing histidine kinase [Clostridia bacterium]|nr:HAMP domain-containing histidine kinase [Clostridia bacterium]
MKLRESLAAKITAVILSYIMAAILVISAIFTVVMGYYKFYFSGVDAVKEEILTNMAHSEANYLEILLDDGYDIEKYYSDKNVFYEVKYIESGEVVTNYNNEPYIALGSSGYYDYKEYSYEKYGEIYWESEEIHIADVKIYVAKDMTKSDMFSVMAKIIDIGYSMRFAMVFIALGSLVLLIVLLCFLYCSAGHIKGGVIKRNYLDLLPFDIYTAAVGFIGFFSVVAVAEWTNDLASAVLWVVVFGSLDYFIALGYTMSFATRVKTRTLIKNTLIYMILRFFGKYINKFSNWIKHIISNVSLIKKTVILLCGILLLEFIALVIIFNTYWYYSPSRIFWFVIIYNIVFVSAVLYLAIILKRIKDGGEKIAKGDLHHKIDTQYMFGDFKEFCVSLNNINEGLQVAVNERMKSEHFKTELITNVSHDIKTPLTSIINYVDLIKKEECENETVKQYIEVLDRQSGRLKKLVEDLVEASKASSGTLNVNLAVCDAGVLLTQALGEFEDRLKKAGITPVLNLPENPVKIMADGRHLWRVFDNLLSNVCKYALGGTRVYLDIIRNNGKVYITFRNISKFQLNVSAEELMERFVRGDTSRNTEGSGLGLSIARSLVELQNGSLELNVDGDLFKVTVEFEEM